MSVDSSKQASRRFSRETRRAMILDSAAELIAEKGTAELSLESIGQHAEVSKTLMYRYFGSLIELLRDLLDQEFKHLRDTQFQASKGVETYEELVRNVTKAYLRYIEDRGLIIERLQAYPNIAGAQDPTHFRREPAVQYFAELTSATFDIPMDIATASTEISFGLPAAAGQYLIKSGADRQTVEDITVAMILGGIVGVQYDALGAKQKLKRPAKEKSGSNGRKKKGRKDS